MSHSSNLPHLPLDQCLERLRTTGQLVIQHEAASPEVKSFLGELIEAILHKAGPGHSTTHRGTGEAEHDLVLPLGIAGQIEGQGLPSCAAREAAPYSVEIAPQTRAILVTNPVTGRTLTCSPEELISWARQQGIDDH